MWKHLHTCVRHATPGLRFSRMVETHDLASVNNREEEIQETC